MPESPEVDSLGGFLREHLTGRRISAIDLEEARALKTRARPLSELHGHAVTGVRRFGKHLSIDTDGPTLLVSFGRAGWARWRDDATDAEPTGPDTPPVIARVGFDGGAELAVTDAGDWLSLGLHVVDDPAEVSSVAKLGPDPASDAFTRADLDAVVTGRRKQLKALLQEQETLSGIGNAYSDEILYAARLSPVAHASTLDEEERAQLFAAIRDVLGGAFEARRDVPPAELKAAKVAAMAVHGRTGEPCPEGHDAVRDVPGSKGAAQYCAACQTGGVPLPE
ncbi:DNA-(apurinic or apyrimidinic site) lyase /formamidopyrimidine-DNA glycosylase [Labedella gwakjiensis]|uniref:DNA-(Apurinic or apyrimidinic site) lyase /formamidopyrimidine-DNA glycosylase n=1 Tax=Labedella gwakjiensis TaxID=390269 RepID=A0A2P8GWG1_9MICO|nr:DNA-formamidopyrimidine glycosylase family protein [Labedella gwakjiensis]PSL38298.1 DNA-(apurinic or apyrimidinic site) lyase /formamidopyrimidine-DNA glycosylase [Labedella gwakjiensis]RUQ87166.1 Fpg/Nei family DNA glycosylase [Labedella gwakjiensis]